ncbi:hypothetical protein CKW46_21725 [Mycobacterium liflandii]|nr:hypothetical protein [Mycobacterium pseudoshottsii]ULL11583.1 hypothetical protein CKW46_21725 [Mycobacterium liflandii]
MGLRIFLFFSVRRFASLFVAAYPVIGFPRILNGRSGRAPALLISRLVSWVDDLWCRAIGAGV